jgi:acetylornithine deacetylase
MNLLSSSAAERAVQLAQALVRINTVNRHSGDAHPGNEGDGQRFIAPLLEALGGRVSLFDCPPDVYTRLGVLGPRDRDFTDRPNLVAEIAYGAGGPTVVVQGHMDTVGVDDMSLDDPFSARIEDGKLWGRGSSDMKGGMAAMLVALEALHNVRSQLHGRVIFASVVEEESNGSGAGALAWIDRARRGELFDLRPEPDGALADLALFRGGTHPAVVAGGATMSLNMSYPAGDAAAAEAAGHGYGNTPGRTRFEQLMTERSEADPWLREHPPRIDWIKDLIPFELPEDHSLVQKIAISHRRVLGTEPLIGVNPAWSDACYLPRFAGTPAVVYGAGVPSQAHTAAEYGEAWRIVDCARVLADFFYETLKA